MNYAQPSVPPEIITEVLADPTRLLADARTGVPDWSTRYGGPEGVAYLTGLVQDQIALQARAVAGLRAAAVLTLLRDRSLASVGRTLGITKQAVHKTSRHTPAAYADLATLDRAW